MFAVSAIVLISCFASSNALFGCWSCRNSVELRTALTSGSATTEWVLATPDPSTVVQTDDQVTVTFRDVVFLNKQAGRNDTDRVASLTVGFEKAGASCAFAANETPYTNGARRIFQLIPAPASGEEQEEQPPQSVPPQPMGQTECRYKDDNGRVGYCIEESACNCGTANTCPYTAISWGSGRVNDGCRRFKGSIKCCIEDPALTVRPVARPANLGAPVPKYVMYSCHDVYNPCINGANCIPRLDGNVLADKAASYGISNEITGLSSLECNSPCRNNGVCNNGACECAFPYTGNTCSQRLADCNGSANEEAGVNCVPQLAFDNIVPGAGDGDTWQVGSQRSVSFRVRGYAGASLPQTVNVFAVARWNRPQDCPELVNVYGTAVGSSARADVLGLRLGSVDLASASNGQETFDARLTVTLSDSACMRAQESYRIVLLPTNAASSGAAPVGLPDGDGPCSHSNNEPGRCLDQSVCSGAAVRTQKSSEGATGCEAFPSNIVCCARNPDYTPPNADNDAADPAFAISTGGAFSIAHTSCTASNGLIGTCKSSSSCSGELAEVAQSSQCNGNTVCCTPKYHTNENLRKYFTFTSPAFNGGANVVRGSRVTVKFAIDESRKPRSCNMDANTPFTLSMYRDNYFRDQKVAVAVTQPTIGQGTAQFEITATENIAIAAGETFYFYAELPGCGDYSSREFLLEDPACQAAATDTILGVCVPEADCMYDNTDDGSLCVGIGGGAKCCYATRTGMSAGFSEETGGKLGAPANKALFSFAAVVIAAFATLF